MTDQEQVKYLNRLRYEKALIQQDMARPGFQLIMTKLDQIADEWLSKYDAIEFNTEIGRAQALRIQIYREVIREIIPKIMSTMLNVDEEEKFSFTAWLRSIKSCISEFICHGWIKKAKELFK